MEQQLFFIKEDYFDEHPEYKKMLDAGNSQKQSNRAHLCVAFEYENNKFYIPLRNNLGDDVRKFGRIGHSIPSQKRKNAGLDYRYALIINDDTYLESGAENKIPNSQYKKINNEYNEIKAEFEVYLNGFIKKAQKGRIAKEPLYRESSLINFLTELGIEDSTDKDK